MSSPALVLAGIAAAGAVPSAAVVYGRRQVGELWRRDLDPYRLEAPSGYEPAHLQRFLSSASGLLASRWDRPVAVRGFGFEIVARRDDIRHFVLIPRRQAETVTGQLRAAIPGVRLTPQLDQKAGPVSLATELVTARPHRQLAVDRPETVVTSILAALGPLAKNERAVIQVLLFPLPRSTQPPSDDAASLWTMLQGKTTTPTADAARSVRDKYSEALFVGSIRLGVATAVPARSRQLLARLVAGCAAASTAQSSLRRRQVSSRTVAAQLMERRAPLLRRPCLLNAAELAGLVALPSRASAHVPGVHFGGLALSPSAEIPREGLVLADSTFSTPRPLAVSLNDSYRHVYLLGPTGGGKTTLLKHIFAQDAEAGRGIVCVLRKGDENEFLNLVPEARLNDVAIMDPADEYPVGLGLWGDSEEPPELAAERILSILHELFRTTWGVWTEDTLRGCLLTLAHRRDLTLIEIPALLSDSTFRRKIVEQLDDPIGLGSFWATYERLTDAQKIQVTGPLLNKLRAILLRPRMRYLLGQAQPRLSLDDVVTTGKILIVPLSDAALGPDAAVLAGSLLLAAVWQSLQRRSRMAPEGRPPIRVLLDEFQDFQALPLPLADMLAQARSLEVGLVLAHQHLDQLDRDLREAVLANARTRVVWQCGATDAARLAKELAPHVSAENLQHLARFEVVMSVSCGNHVAPPVTGLTRPEPKSTGQAAAARAASRARYGRPKDEIEAELRQRHGHGQAATKAPVGRRRRST